MEKERRRGAGEKTVMLSDGSAITFTSGQYLTPEGKQSLARGLSRICSPPCRRRTGRPTCARYARPGDGHPDPGGRGCAFRPGGGRRDISDSLTFYRAESHFSLTIQPSFTIKKIRFGLQQAMRRAVKFDGKQCGAMAAKQVILTKEGLEALENELEYLKQSDARKLRKIKVALSFGDLSENSEYDEAKNDQAIMESRIAEIMAMLKNSKLIDESEISDEHIHIGSKVEVKITGVTGQAVRSSIRLSVQTRRTPRRADLPMSRLSAKRFWGICPGNALKLRSRRVL